MSRVDEETLIKASITYGADAPSEVVDRIGEARTYAIMASAMSLAVDNAFPKDVASETIQQFAASLKTRFPDGAGEIKPMVVEAMIRAIRGEGQLLEGIDHKDVLNMLFLITYAIMSHENLHGDQLDAYVGAVIKLADAS